MKKGVLVLICVLLFLITAGAGAAWLYLSPEGALRSDLPGTVMEAYLADKTPDFWKAEYMRQIQLPVTEFEDAEALLSKIYDTAVGAGTVTFSPITYESGGDARSYLIRLGEADLFRAVERYVDGTWQVTALTALDNLTGMTHEISVLLPSDAALTVNGVRVSENYLSESGLAYPDMTALERKLPDFPTRKRYVVSGLYEAPTVEASREGGLVLLSAADGVWEYTVPDAAGYAFAVSAPREAVVRLGGVELGSENIAASSVYSTQLNIPIYLQEYLPAYVTYTAGGLYSLPEITASLPDGTPLTAVETNGSLSFSLPGTEALREEHHVQAEEFIRALTTYGAGNAPLGSVSAFVSPDSEVQRYLNGALASLHWTAHVTLSFQNVVADNFIPLGEEAYICRIYPDFTTQTWHETKEISLVYETLWVNEGGAWKVWDLAFL